MNWKIGDVVKLKSGGPLMTITHSPDADSRVCSTVWFSGDKKDTSHFPAESLELYVEPTYD
jgi:uncharacterized protein YodC (DUF2158 family)